jgi:hypothetical protein
MINLPRQARDKHRENSKKNAFSAARFHHILYISCNPTALHKNLHGENKQNGFETRC